MIAEALLEQGMVPPLDFLPEVWPSAEPYRRAFHVLSAARGHGMNGPLSLTYAELLAYAGAQGFAGSITELEEFTRLVQEQDAAYLKHAAAQLERPTKAP